MAVKRAFLGEFEQMVLLAILSRENDASALGMSAELERSAGRSVSRGALYTTLERLKEKGLVDWRVEPGDQARSGLPRRHFAVTAAGAEAIGQARAAMLALWKNAEKALEELAP